MALVLLWHMEAKVQPGRSVHPLGVTAITLIFGWSLAVIAASLPLLGVTLDGNSGIHGFQT